MNSEFAWYMEEVEFQETLFVSQPAVRWYVSHQYNDAIMSAIGSQITGVLIVWSTVCSGVDKKNPSKLRITGLCERLTDWETETETSLFNTWHYTDAWYQTYTAVVMYYSVLTLYQLTNLHFGRPLLRPFSGRLIIGHPGETKKYSASNEKCWHHFRILITDKRSVVWNDGKNREFLFTGWKSLWSIETWLVISDKYIGEVMLQLSVEAMASHSNSTKPLPKLRTEYILLIPSSSTTHYVCLLSGAVYTL